VGTAGSQTPKIFRNRVSSDVVLDPKTKVQVEENRRGSFGLEVPHHPHGILRSAGSTPRASFRNLRMSPRVVKREFVKAAEETEGMLASHAREKRTQRRKESNASLISFGGALFQKCLAWKKC